MFNVDLIQQRMVSLEVRVNLFSEAEAGQQIDVGFRFSFNVNFAEDNKHCKAILEQEAISLQDPSKLKIRVTNEGLFETDEIKSDEMKKEVHIRCYQALFPYVQSQIAQMCISAGLPPLLVPAQKMNPESIIIGRPTTEGQG